MGRRRVTRSAEIKLEEDRLRVQAEKEELARVGKRILERAKEVEVAPYPRKCVLKPGTRSTREKDAKRLTWTCPNPNPKCKRINRPERRLLTILPVLRCECGRKCKIEFDFSMHKVELNGHSLIPNIRQQGKKECSPCSILSTAEICWRINAILSGLQLEDNEPSLAIGDLLDKLDYLGRMCGINKRWNQEAVQTMGEVIATIGVESVGNNKAIGTESKPPKDDDIKMYKLPYFSGVKMSFHSICRLLADGHAIRTSIYTGKNFSKLRPGKIYKSPGRGRVRHAITLVGAGRRRNMYYYHFLNSWGRKFCLRKKLRLRLGKRAIIQEKARGGFGIIRASDICAIPVTFLRHERDLEIYKELLLEEIIPNVQKTREAPEEGSIRPLCSALKLSKTVAVTEHAMLVHEMAVRPATGDKETGALTSKSYDTIGSTGVIAIVDGKKTDNELEAIQEKRNLSTCHLSPCSVISEKTKCHRGPIDPRNDMFHKAQEKLSTLYGGIGFLQFGGAGGTAVRDENYGVPDASNSGRSAAESIVPDAVSFSYATKGLDKVSTKNNDGKVHLTTAATNVEIDDTNTRKMIKQQDLSLACNAAKDAVHKGAPARLSIFSIKGSEDYFQRCISQPSVLPEVAELGAHNPR